MKKDTAKLVLSHASVAQKKANLEKVKASTSSKKRQARRTRILAMRETQKRYGMDKVMGECIPTLHKKSAKRKKKATEKKEGEEDDQDAHQGEAQAPQGTDEQSTEDGHQVYEEVER